MIKIFKETEHPKYEWLWASVLALAVSTLIRIFLFEPFTIVGGSMYPTLINDDHVTVIKYNITADTIKKGDIIVFKAAQHENRIFVKRVIATGGDTIEIINGIVLVNDKRLSEPYIKQEDPIHFRFYPRFKIPHGSVFVLGDNRNNSEDSRSRRVGMVSIRDISGKVTSIYYPFDRIYSFNQE